MGNTKSTAKQNHAIPGKHISQEEFTASIQEAEKGPFYTIEESKKMFEEWRRKHYKL